MPYVGIAVYYIIRFFKLPNNISIRLKNAATVGIRVNLINCCYYQWTLVFLMHNRHSEAFRILPATILISCHKKYYDDEAADQYCVTLWQILNKFCNALSLQLTFWRLFDEPIISHHSSVLLTLTRQEFVTTCLRSTTSTSGSFMATLRIQVMSKPYTFSHPGKYSMT